MNIFIVIFVPQRQGLLKFSEIYIVLIGTDLHHGQYHLSGVNENKLFSLGSSIQGSDE